MRRPAISARALLDATEEVTARKDSVQRLADMFHPPPAAGQTAAIPLKLIRAVAQFRCHLVCHAGSPCLEADAARRGATAIVTAKC